jgi:hypothetical protein
MTLKSYVDSRKSDATYSLLSDLSEVEASISLSNHCAFRKLFSVQICIWKREYIITQQRERSHFKIKDHFFQPGTACKTFPALLRL